VNGRALLLLVAGAASLGAACRSERPAAHSRQILIWKEVGAWSGRTSLQTESFTSDTGAFQIHWESRSASDTPGALRVTLHSAVSGRPLEVPVDHQGDGKASVYVAEDPREFYLAIEARNAAWTVRLDEGVRAVEKSP